MAATSAKAVSSRPGPARRRDNAACRERSRPLREASEAAHFGKARSFRPIATCC